MLKGPGRDLGGSGSRSGIGGSIVSEEKELLSSVREVPGAGWSHVHNHVGSLVSYPGVMCLKGTVIPCMQCLRGGGCDDRVKRPGGAGSGVENCCSLVPYGTAFLLPPARARPFLSFYTV